MSGGEEREKGGMAYLMNRQAPDGEQRGGKAENQAGSPVMIEATDLAVRHGKTLALSLSRLEVRRGETLALIGPNGAGKSTLLLALALLQPAAGSIRIAGELATAENALRLRRRMAVVFQEPLLLDTTVAENIATGLRLRGAPRAERDASVAHWLEAFGVSHLAKRSARTLSGGEAQRTSLARAFALGPEVVFLDEPFSALDTPTRSAVTSDLLAILRTTRTTTVLVTHDRDEALAFGDRLGVLIGGEVRQVGTPETVFGAPVDPEVAAFVGVETVWPGVIVERDEGLTTVRAGECLVEVSSPLPKGAPVYLCLRPEDVTLHALSEGRGMSSARNRLAARISRLAPWGGQVRVTLDCGFPLVAVVTRRSAAEMGLAEGVSVLASFKATAAHLIPRSASEVEAGARPAAAAPLLHPL